MRLDNPFFDFERNFRFSPTHSVVVNLKKARKHLESFESMNLISAEKTYHSFIRSLSKNLSSPSVYRRFKNQIPAIAGIEKSEDHRFHFHMLIEKPDHISDKDFEKAINEAAENNPYVESGKYSIHITDLKSKNENDISRIIQYNMKSISRDNSAFVM
jgi:hypothetical protein